MNSKVFSLKLSNVMSDNMYDRFVGNQKSGKFNSKKSWKVTVGSERVFMKRQERLGKKYSILLLIDESGSMTINGKIEMALSTSMFLAKALGHNNVDFSIFGFNANTEIHKDFKEKFTERLVSRVTIEADTNVHSAVNKVMGKQGKNMRASWCNHDLEALEKCYNYIKGRPGKKIIMVFSDGRPNCDDSDCYYQSQKQKDKIKPFLLKIASRGVDTLGVGIMDTSVKEFYPNHILIKSMDEFTVKVLEATKKLIKRC